MNKLILAVTGTDNPLVINGLFILAYGVVAGFILLGIIKLSILMNDKKIIHIILSIAIALFIQFVGNPFSIDTSKLKINAPITSQAKEESKIEAIDNVSKKYNVEYKKLKNVLDKQKIDYANSIEVEKVANTIKTLQ